MPEWWENKNRDKKVYAEWQALKTPEGLDYYMNVVTQETSWEKPDALKTEAELAATGEWVWMPDERECFRAAKLCGESGGQITLQTEDGCQHTVKQQTLQKLKPASLLRVVEDLTLLDEMSTALILHNLRKRFEKHKIYTNIGTILISINPYTNLGLYTPEKVSEYNARGINELEPHVFNIAYDAYHGVTSFKMPQSIIISGESGAGKTEATKQCLSFIASAAGSIGGVEKKILQANPILEAFGNAKTVRNDNSSRFGKYMEVFFNTMDQITSSRTTNYLLEKIRVVQPGPTERNFHIFYHLTTATDAQTRQQYSLGQANDYLYLNQTGCIEVPTINDAQDYLEMRQALNDLLFSPSEQSDMFSLLSGILALGNIAITDNGDTCTIGTAWSPIAAQRLFVDPQVLQDALRTKKLIMRGQDPVTMNQTAKQASDSRHAMAKFIYGAIFDWIVKKVNESMQGGDMSGISIGILDIFGFEIFEQNSFEQLCINLTNEMLQQHFNNHTFKLEEKIYAQEGINFQHIDFIDNQPVLDMLMSKPFGVFNTFDEELVIPKGNDRQALAKIVDRHSASGLLGKVLGKQDLFSVRHYAGEVMYDSVGFLEKNRDTLTEDLLQVLYTSTQPLLNVLFDKNKVVSSGQKKASLAKQFQKQLNTLMAQLNKTEPHYIRCVKPNADKSASTFVPKMCLDQMTYAGVFEAVAIRKQGYPFRLTHQKFWDRYKCVLDNPNQSFGNSVQGCQAIAAHLKMSSENIKTGKTMMLYRADEHKQMELIHSVKMVAIEMDEKLTHLVNTDTTRMDQMTKDRYLEQLSRAVTKADEFRVTTPISNRARDLLDEYIEARIDPQTKAMIQAAYDSRNQQQLEAAIAVCEQNGYNTKMCKRCKKLLVRVKKINEETDIAAQCLEEKQVIAIVNAADEIGMTTEWLEYFRGLVRGPAVDFMQAQFDAAKKQGMDDRAIRIWIRIKDDMYEKEAAKYEMTKYPKLLEPLEWAKGSLFGGKGDAGSFLTWQPKLLHKPLLQPPPSITDPKLLKEYNVKAKTQFKYLMKYMEQRACKTGENIRGREMVGEGLTDPLVRDEIYMQIYKQLQMNPDATAERKAWDMLGLCLTTYPPSPELEPYMECWLRKSAPSHNVKYRYKGWLRERIYHGAKTESPSEEQLAAAEITLTSRNRGFSEPLPPGLPSWNDLLTPYSDADITQTFTAAAPVPRASAIDRAQTAAQPAPFVPQMATIPSEAAAPALPPAAPPAAAPCVWTAIPDEASGENYYYNSVTGESTWEMPAELKYATLSPKGT